MSHSIFYCILLNLMGLLFTKSQSFSHQSSFSFFYLFIFFIFIVTNNAQLYCYNKIKCDKIIIKIIKDVRYMYGKKNIQGVPGGMDKTSGECSLC